ncbi:hypothetical protein DLE01_35200 [Streptomyces sp. FT05W]|nr:hypothetical protein [Streptomyces sp. FT05W]PWS46271.1 hypothetical protein DLE01_35200 [Streptomyces sp. FT05W]
MRRKACAVLLLAATAFGVAGCAGEPPAWENIPDAEVRDLSLTEGIRIERAEQKLIKVCMERHHLRYWEFPVPDVDERKKDSFVIDDVRWAEKYGYGRVFGERGERIRASHPTIVLQNNLVLRDRTLYRRTLDGDPGDRMEAKLPGGHGSVTYPRGGCTNEARGALYGDAETWYRASRTVESLLPLYVQDLRKDKRFTEALAGWAECMRTAGRPFASPEELRAAREAAVRKMPQPEADVFDKRLAVTEATCAVESSLAGTTRSLEKAYRSEAVKPYRAQWDSYRKMRLHALRQAQDVLS